LALLVFLTGIPGVGKSTVVRQVAETLRLQGVKIGGMTSADMRAGPARVGFEIRDLLSNKAGVLAHINQPTGARIGKYRVNSEDLDRIGAEAILSAIKEADFVVIDEVGPMELTSERFKEAVHAALNCGKPVLGTVHRKAQDPIVKTIRSGSGIEVIEVTYENRDSLPALLVQRFRKELR